MEYLIRLEAPMLGFSFIDKKIDCLCGKKLIKIEKNSGKVVYDKEILKRRVCQEFCLQIMNRFL